MTTYTDSYLALLPRLIVYTNLLAIDENGATLPIIIQDFVTYGRRR